MNSNEDNEKGPIVRVGMERRKWGKFLTIITGLESKNPTIDINDIIRRLRIRLRTNVISTNDQIEIEGNHIFKTKEFLKDEGFDL
ncbi:MAG: hypothetical protein HeimC3_18200 [Candidatus Heimdallarchaeota archaeon LC_3]|nr:MAG: hypothetical protein HeimC3_18200 [Candidatus Heimdallarchaeota archaeon LC_3]